MDRFFAHSLPGRPTEEWQDLEKHLGQVAELTATFAAERCPVDRHRGGLRFARERELKTILLELLSNTDGDICHGARQGLLPSV